MPPSSGSGSSGITLLIRELGGGRFWVVSPTPQPLYFWERPGTHCLGKSVSTGSVMAGAKNHFHQDSNPGPSRTVHTELSRPYCLIQYVNISFLRVFVAQYTGFCALGKLLNWIFIVMLWLVFLNISAVVTAALSVVFYSFTDCNYR
jgi:hypothetical protein